MGDAGLFEQVRGRAEDGAALEHERGDHADRSAVRDALNREQQKAVAHRDGPLAVLAGPGTGKTRVIINRVASLIEEGAEPSSILALTFTVRAADELRERLASAVSPSKADAVQAGTFHGFGRRLILRFRDRLGMRREPKLLDSAQRARLLRSIISNGDVSDRLRARRWSDMIEELLRDFEQLSNHAVTPKRARLFAEDWQGRIDREDPSLGLVWDEEERARQLAMCEEFAEKARLYELYKRACAERCCVSFADLIALPIRLLEDSRVGDVIRGECRHIVVDEFQDVNLTQIELLRRLAPAERRPDLCVVGDDDQSIYLFRGADDLAFRRFSQIWRGHAQVELKDNHRSLPALVRITNSVIARGEDRFAPDKEIQAKRGHTDGGATAGVSIVTHPDGEARAHIAEMIRERAAVGWKYKEMAVIARTHTDLDRIAAELRVSGVPAVRAREDGALHDAGVQDVLHWIELLADPTAMHAVRRLLVRPLLAVTSDRVGEWERAFHARASRDEARPSAVAFLRAGLQGGDLIKTPHETRSVKRLMDWWDELHELSARAPAYDVVFRIVSLTGVAHGELLAPHERDARIDSLATLLRFVHGLQDRIDAPGDLAALWSYYQDLSDDDRVMRDVGRDPVDGAAEARFSEDDDAVRLITAHASKGLEFPVVFVPRVEPGHGYPRTQGESALALPEGLEDRAGDERTAKERQLAEERRVFYVACTRAKDELVLFSRATKGRSSSTHFTQEMLYDPELGGGFTRIDARGNPGDVGSAPGGEGAPPALTGEARDEVLARARSGVRRSAALALDVMDDVQAGEEEHRRAQSRFREASVRLNAVALVEAGREVPGRGTDAELDAYVTELERSLALGLEGCERAGMTPPLHLSYTAINDYERCPRCFYLKHVKKIREPGDQALRFGSSIHGALELFYKEWRDAELEGRTQPGVERLLEIGRTRIIEDTPENQPVSEEDLKRAESMLRLTHQHLHADDAHILELERTVSFPHRVDGTAHTLVAKIDRIDQTDAGLKIIDYKTGKASKDKLEPKNKDLQFGIYAMALNHLYGGLYGGEGDAEGTGSPMAGIAEYWLLAAGQRGSIALPSLDMVKIRGVIDTAVRGMLSGEFGPRKGCSGLCAQVSGLGF